MKAQQRNQAQELIRVSMAQLRREQRPYYKDFINQEFDNRTMRTKVNKFILDNLLKLQQHQNVCCFALQRFAYYYEIGRENQTKLDVMKKELENQQEKQDQAFKFAKRLTRELNEGQRNAQTLSLFISKRMWQIVQMTDVYGDQAKDMYNIRFEGYEKLLRRQSNITSIADLIQKIRINKMQGEQDDV